MTVCLQYRGREVILRHGIDPEPRLVLCSDLQSEGDLLTACRLLAPLFRPDRGDGAQGSVAPGGR